ncbi:MAG: LacI family DNA-binding transcriptional regulator [Kiloniellales bacterium]
MREIAHQAGVSIATVSRVLNQPDVVTEETRLAVEQVIKRNHYVSHGMAMSLASNRSSTLGLVIPTITNSIYASSTQAIQQVAQRAGYTVLLGVSEFSPEQEEALIRRLIERRVEGMILTGGERPDDLYQLLERNGVPYIVTWKLMGGGMRPCVSFDNYEAGRLAMKHLTGLGHRRIGLVCGRSSVNDRARERRRAYEDALSELGLAVDPNLVFERDFEFIEGRAAMHRMLRDQEPPTAVFCANDIQAIGAMTECLEAGLRVPQDISIIGFDDLPVAQYTHPQLTTIRVPAKRMGHLAASKLIGWLKLGEEPAMEELPVELVVRGTTGPVQLSPSLGSRQ